MSAAKQSSEKALKMLRNLPRVALGNIRDNPNSKQNDKRGRGQHGGDYHGAGNKGSGQRQNFMRIGYETGNTPFYLRFGYEPYYKGHHLRREYPPMTLQQLQTLIDTDRINSEIPIDLPALCNTGLFIVKPDQRHYGLQLKDDGAEQFKAQINIEVQHASELAIATIEKNGGVIRTAYYDTQSLWTLVNTQKWLEKGVPIPRRMLPPQDAIDYYTNPKNRGYLADPEEISKERLILAQKYGYDLPKIENDPKYSMLSESKDPRQIFYGLNPGWVISLKDKAIIRQKI